MHEYSIIQSLVDSVEKRVEDRHSSLSGQARSVVHIEVRIGELSGVDCVLLQTAFEIFRAGTICELATMSIEKVPTRWNCPKCRREIPKGAELRCKACDEPARLTSGDEIILQRIEVEVPDVSGLRMR